MSNILFVDAYDSFANNIAALLFLVTGAKITTIRTDTDLSCFRNSSDGIFPKFDAIVLGPGPGHPSNPADIGQFSFIWEVAAEYQIPVLGICLGFQGLCHIYGVPVTSMDLPCHGQSMLIHHNDKDIFHRVGKVSAICYNSLAIRMESFQPESGRSRPGSPPSCESSVSAKSTSSEPMKPCAQDNKEAHALQVLAYSTDNYVMAVKHAELPFWGLQFHPESCKSSFSCHDIIRNWWHNVQLYNKQTRIWFVHPSYDGASCALQALSVEQCSETRSLGADECLKHVLGITQTCASDVQYRQLPLQCSAEAIARLCYKTSKPGRIAMLESTKKGRFSIYAMTDESTWQLKYAEGVCHLLQDDKENRKYSIKRREVLDVIEDFVTQRQAQDGPSSTPFWGGFIGFLSYEFGLDGVIGGGDAEDASRAVPGLSLLWIERSIIVDHDEKQVFIQSIRSNDSAWIKDTISSLEELAQPCNTTSKPFDSSTFSTIISNTSISLPSKSKHLSQVQTCLSHLYAGNSYELCLTTTSTISTPRLPDTAYYLYQSLQYSNPAPYSGFLQLSSTAILSSSPECFLVWSRDDPYRLSMIPMKGTVARTPGMTLEKAKAILATPKEVAENQMIADLIRHDLYGVVGHKSTVRADKLCEILEFESVYQMVSHIEAYPPIADNSTKLDARKQVMHYGIKALKTALPPGSMTGAPKKRSCEILRDIERRKRGVYSGVVGYLDIGGGGEWSVAIRCAWSCDDYKAGRVEPTRQTEDTMKWHVDAGGAITVLSDPEAEWEEMRGKMNSVLKAFR